MKIFDKTIRHVEQNGVRYIDERDVSKLFKLESLDKDSLGFFKPNLCCEDYSYSGDYLNFSKISVESWEVVSLDKEGIPKNNFRWGEYYYPITIAHYGLELYGKLHCATKFSVDSYMGNGGRCNVSETESQIIVSCSSSLKDGYHVSGIMLDSIDAVKIKTHGRFRLYMNIECGATSKSVCIYEGLTNLESGYFSVLDLSDIAGLLGADDKNLTVSEFKVRGDVEVEIDKSSLIVPVEFIDKIKLVKDWFLRSQGEDGTWRSYFDHTFFKGRTNEMASGWPSALGQGLALSFLCRYQNLFPAFEIEEACRRAIEIFGVCVENGGILRYWNGDFKFFEEYPTSPASFVLNGFIFSLLGLYDCWRTFGFSSANELFEEGVSTLKKMLPLFDLGSRSAYDLTHYTCGDFPNVARWGYHATHLNQLYALYTITGDEYFKVFYDRWSNYMLGGFSCRSN